MNVDDYLADVESRIRSSASVRESGGAPVVRVECWRVSGGIACEFEFENGRVGSGVFYDDIEQGAWFVGEGPDQARPVG